MFFLAKDKVETPALPGIQKYTQTFDAHSLTAPSGDQCRGGSDACLMLSTPHSFVVKYEWKMNTNLETVTFQTKTS